MIGAHYYWFGLAFSMLSVSAKAQVARPIPARIILLATSNDAQKTQLFPAKVVSSVARYLPAFSLSDSPVSLDTSAFGDAASLRKGTVCYSYKYSQKAVKSPLYVINGKVQKAWRLRNLSASQVEQIVVLKPEQALAIYGLRGRYGVVIVTKKKIADL